MHSDPQPLCRETEEFLHVQIPITKAMGVRVETYDVTSGHLALTAPLEANHNHLGTAFGGSLSALCTLAGYALLWLEMAAQNPSDAVATKFSDTKAHIVVKESKIVYRRPVKEPVIRVTCQRPDAEVMSAFHRRFTEKAKASIELSCTTMESGHVCVEFTGTYVAIR